MPERTVLAVDVSSHQKDIMPGQLAAGGVELVIPKAASGYYEDSKFAEFADKILTGGIALGAYFWDDPILDSQKQVDKWMSIIARYPGKIAAVFLDDEQWWSVWGDWLQAVQYKLAWALVHRFNPDNLSLHLKTTAQLMKDALQKYGFSGKLAIYTSYGFVTSYAPKMASWLGQYDLWVAHYGRQVTKGTAMSWATFTDKETGWLPNYAPLLPPGGRDPIGHQFTGDHVLLAGMIGDNGLRSPADVSLFNRQWLFGAAVTFPPAVTPEPVNLITLDRRVSGLEDAAKKNGWSI